MPAIASVRYHHDAIIDEIISFPSISQGELAARFGFTQSWMSIIINSDAFKERLAERKGVLVDPRIAANVDERLDAVARRSLDKLLERLDTQQPFSNTELIAAAKLGVGNKPPAQVGVQNNTFVMQIPSQAPDAKTWMQRVAGNSGNITDVSHSNPEV